jgi:phenylacetate-coenzyme A ligase PaaK-like adenylate-forming protein
MLQRAAAGTLSLLKAEAIAPVALSIEPAQWTPAPARPIIRSLRLPPRPMPHRPPLPMNPWLWSGTFGETYAAGLDPLGTALRQRNMRLAALLATAAADSPFYRRRRPRQGSPTPSLEPWAPVDKAELMQHFDDWATDRRITRAGVDAFLADPTHLGDAYLGRYLVWTSSGTSGEPGIFVQDEQALAAYDALDALRLHGSPGAMLPWPVWGGLQRYAFVAATGGHFAGVASIERLQRVAASAPLLPWLAPTVQTFSVQQPLDALAEALQAFDPTVLITYPSCADALAQAQAGGTLRLALSQVWVGGEQLSAEQRTRIRSAFNCRVHNNYGSSEFYAMAWECADGCLHLNHDWLILEPVDRQLRTVPPGEASHSVLLTHLANRTQPLLRYRLDDSVRFLPDPCACGSHFPAIEVQGRADHTLVLHDGQRHAVRLLPLALTTAIEEGAQVTRFQLLCTAPDRMELRFEPGQPDAAAAFGRSRAALTAYLATQGLAHVQVAHSHAAPLRSSRSGKLQRVLMQPARRTGATA